MLRRAWRAVAVSPRRRYVTVAAIALVAVSAVGAWRGVWPDWNAVIASVVVVLIALPTWVRDTSATQQPRAMAEPSHAPGAREEVQQMQSVRPYECAIPDPQEGQKIAALAHALAGAIWRRRDIERIAGQAGVPRSYVDFAGNAEAIWDEVLNQAQARPAPIVQSVLALARDQAPTPALTGAIADWYAHHVPRQGTDG